MARSAISSLPPDRAAAVAIAADRLGLRPAELAAIISNETIGTFDPGIWGGTNGKYFGLIQFGPEERRVYGVDTKNPDFNDQLRAAVEFALDRGFVPGKMNAGDLYATILGGNPGVSRSRKSGGVTINQWISRIFSDANLAKMTGVLGDYNMMAGLSAPPAFSAPGAGLSSPFVRQPPSFARSLYDDAAQPIPFNFTPAVRNNTFTPVTATPPSQAKPTPFTPATYLGDLAAPPNPSGVPGAARSLYDPLSSATTARPAPPPSPSFYDRNTAVADAIDAEAALNAVNFNPYQGPLATPQQPDNYGYFKTADANKVVDGLLALGQQPWAAQTAIAASRVLQPIMPALVTAQAKNPDGTPTEQAKVAAAQLGAFFSTLPAAKFSAAMAQLDKWANAPDGGLLGSKIAGPMLAALGGLTNVPAGSPVARGPISAAEALTAAQLQVATAPAASINAWSDPFALTGSYGVPATVSQPGVAGIGSDARYPTAAPTRTPAPSQIAAIIGGAMPAPSTPAKSASTPSPSMYSFNMGGGPASTTKSISPTGSPTIAGAGPSGPATAAPKASSSNIGSSYFGDLSIPSVSPTPYTPTAATPSKTVTATAPKTVTATSYQTVTKSVPNPAYAAALANAQAVANAAADRYTQNLALDAQLSAPKALPPKTITVTTKVPVTTTKQVFTSPQPGLSAPSIGGIGGTGPGIYGFANSTPSGTVGYTVANGLTTYSTNNGTGTITFNTGTGAVVGASGTSAGMYGMGPSGGPGASYGGPTGMSAATYSGGGFAPTGNTSPVGTPGNPTR